MKHNDIYKMMASMAVILITVCLCLTGCTSDDPDVIVREPQQITFATPVISGMTRAPKEPGPGSEIGVPGEITTYPTNERFIVIGKKYPAGAYKGWSDASSEWEFQPAENVNVEEQRDKVFHDSYMNTWRTKKLHFWEEGKDYTFAAYSPARVRNTGYHIVNYDETGLHIQGFSPEEVISDQYDLMFSERIYGINNNNGINKPGTSNPNTYDGVNIKFRHALSSIHFKVCIHPDAVKANPTIKAGDYHIESIVVKGFYKKGNFNEGMTSESSAAKTTYAAAADNQKWTIEQTAANEHTEGFNFLPTGGIDLKLPDPLKLTANDAALDVMDKDYNGFHALLLPQTMGTSAVVVVKWKKKTDTTFTETTLKLKDYNTEWKMGYRYTYIIAFSEDLIFFSPNISKMEDDGILIL